MSSTREKPLADHAPKLFRKLNPHILRRLTGDLIKLAGPEETPRQAKQLVAEYVIDVVIQEQDSIQGISPEDFAAQILAKSGVVGPTGGQILRSYGSPLPVVNFEGANYVVDFGTRSAFRPINDLQIW